MKNNFVHNYWRSGCWITLITVLSLMPAPPEVETLSMIPHKDKLVHFSMYFGMCGLLLLDTKSISLTIQLPLAVFGMAYGAFIEFAQGFTETRASDLWDGFANSLGAFGAFVVVRYLIKTGRYENLALRLDRLTLKK